MAQAFLTFLALLALFAVCEALTKYVPHRGLNKSIGTRLLMSVIIVTGIVLCLDYVGKQGG